MTEWAFPSLGPSRGSGVFVYLNLVDDDSGRAPNTHNLVVQKLNRNAPLGLFYLAATARSKGFDTDVLDQQVETFTAASLVQRVRNTGARFVGFYACDYDPLIHKVARYIRLLKAQTSALVIAGGPTFDPEPLLDAGCDAVALGEGEVTLADLLELALGDRPLAEVRGIVYRESGTTRHGPDAPLIRDLDALPFPVRKHQRAYDIVGNPNCRKPVLELQSARGCPMRCAFCSSPNFWGKRYRHRSPENVLAEIDELVTVHGARYLHFRDDLFGIDARWLDRFMNLYGNYERRRPWSCYLHPRSFGEDRERYLRELARLGLNMIAYGLQSADPDILKGIRRRSGEPAMLAEHLRLARKFGILTFVSVIFGLPGENGDGIRDTERFLKKHRPDLIVVLPLTPLKGSQIGDEGIAPDRQTSLAPAQVLGHVERVTRSFFASPLHLLRLGWYVLRHNPGWVLRAIPRLRHGLVYIQFFRREPVF